MQKISDRLKEAMKLRNLKPVDLVNRTKISKGAISSYIAGNYTPKSKNIYSLAKALNVSPVWLLGYDVPMNDETNSNNEKNDLTDFLLSTNYEDIESIVKNDKDKKIIKYFSTPDIVIDIYSDEMNNELVNICNHYENTKKLKDEIISDIIEKTLTLSQNLLTLSEETKDAISDEYCYDVKRYKLILAIKKYYSKRDILNEIYLREIVESNDDNNEKENNLKILEQAIEQTLKEIKKIKDKRK